MSRRTRPAVVVAMVLSLSAMAVLPGVLEAKRPEPPPAGPRIVGYGNGHAVDSDGNLYRVDRRASAPCITELDGGLVGNLFGGPPPSPVVDVSGVNGAVSVALENGDVYYWCTDTGLPGFPVHAGNIFALAGTASLLPDVSTFAPPEVMPPTAGDLDGQDHGTHPGMER